MEAAVRDLIRGSLRPMVSFESFIVLTGRIHGDKKNLPTSIPLKFFTGCSKTHAPNRAEIIPP